jgi:hypothetical protein
MKTCFSWTILIGVRVDHALVELKTHLSNRSRLQCEAMQDSVESAIGHE